MQPAKQEQWQMAIGKLMFSFGFIELHLNQLLGCWLADEIYEHISSDPLSKRLRFAIALAPAHSIDQTFVDDLTALLESIAKLAEKRNMVAHNPVLLDSRRLASGKWDMKDVIRHPRRAEKYLALKDLEDVAQDAAIASEDLFRFFTSAVQQIMEGRHGKAGAPRLETIAKIFGAKLVGVAKNP